MPLNDLRQFIDLLDKRRQLLKVSTPISPELEITEVTDRVCKGPPGQNKALLFEKPAGFDVPVLMNAFGSAERMAWALGVDRLEELSDNLARLIDMRMPKGLGAAVGRG